MAPNEESHGRQEKANADLYVYEPKQDIKNEHLVLQSCNFTSNFLHPSQRFREHK